MGSGSRLCGCPNHSQPRLQQAYLGGFTASKFDDWEPPSANKPKVTALKSKPAIEPAYPVTWLQEAVLNLNTPSIVKGLIDQGAFVLIYGPSGSGKSFFTADIAQAVATAYPWRGRKTQGGLVVYVAAEAGYSILRRFIAWRDERLGEAHGDVPLAILTRGPNLLASVQVDQLCEQLSAMSQAKGLPVVMVIFDTLSRSIHGGDENKAEDMTMVISCADHLRDQFKAATVYVHHSGKDPAKGARGHSALFAAADVVLCVSDGAATLEKVRDGVAGERFPFSLEVVELGEDADGDPVRTCLLNESDRPRSRPQGDPRGKNQQIVLKPLREMIASSGTNLPETSAIPKGAVGVSIEALVIRAAPKFATLPEWRARQRIAEALMGLQATGFIGVHGDWVWLT